MLGFLIFVCIGCVFIGIGIYCFRAKKEVRFWANTKTLKMENMKKYNCALGKLWISYGAVFMLWGLPSFAGKHSPYFLISVFGIVIETLTAMTVYTLVIEKKYKSQNKMNENNYKTEKMNR